MGPEYLGMMTMGTLFIVVVIWLLPLTSGTLVIWPLAVMEPPVAVYGSPPIITISGILVVTTEVDVGVAYGISP
jgi:hypothetical protein